MSLQVPTPPTPPTPHFDPNLFFMSGDAPGVIVVIVIAALIAATIILRPIMRALAHRLESKGGDPSLRGEVASMRDRLAEIDALQARIAEMEDRLDFTERLLAQAREPDRLPR